MDVGGSHHNPETLYKQCITCYVKNLRPKVAKLDEIESLRSLPPSILADMYLAVSRIYNIFGVNEL